MDRLTRQVKADFLKLKKTPFFFLHALILILGVFLFLSYQSMVQLPGKIFTLNFFQFLSWVYPIIVTGLCTIVTTQEIEAGGGFFLLEVPSRSIPLFSKLLFLLLSGLFSCIFIALLFTLGMSVISEIASFPFVSTSILALVIWICSLFQYFFHLWIGLQFGKAVNFAIVSAQFLLSALLLTSLGEFIWFFFPSAWGMRLLPLVATNIVDNSISLHTNFSIELTVMGGEILLIILFIFFWLKR